MKKKILVLGSNGMAGHVVFNYLKSTGRYNVVGFSRKDLKAEDILNGFGYDSIEFEMPDVVVNCIGLVNKYANDPLRKGETVFINSFFPHALNELCFHLNSKLIHISTDCIYSGNKSISIIGDNKMITTYSKDDLSDAEDIYGKTKFLGEVTDKKALTLRQSIIGPELKNGIGLLNWFLSLPLNSEIDGYTTHLWNGITTLQLAKDIELHIENNTCGLFVGANTWYIDKYNLLLLMKEIFGRHDIKINPNSVKSKNMVLSSDRGKNTLSFEFMLRELKEYMYVNRNVYGRYKEYLN